ncbi:endonuclease/exonuclease/phosphatase family protein [Tessaracoccus sp. MC1679]|uniref:exodeoxyribonuclease III n=1 Tax=Tessaracoccus sp. MC1679 TaxID=2760313 RepID=UPI0016048ADB|nr:exodeoxyribonuclease III [Tessaracoccus sp. MC1679]MBB1516699.1 endonuclease/exonuclease/phosphatase family protein [Tessaracoccus sp. MC1679]
MRIGTHNVNGIRAALRRGFRPYWDATAADVIALQEVRCRVEDLPFEAFHGYHVTLDPGQRAGRNGVAVLTRTRPARVRSLDGTATQFGPDLSPEPVPAVRIINRDLANFATEGRYLEVDLADAPLRVASLYLPKGAAWPHEEGTEEKYLRKMRFMRGFARLLTTSRREAAAEGREFLVMGDFNIAHTRQDLRNWRTNQRSEGFLPEERDWFGSILSPRSLVDVVRRVHPDAEGPYSWWSWRGQAWANDAGWRIDYHLASPGLARSATAAWVGREASYEARISDHSPVVVDYRLPERAFTP